LKKIFLSGLPFLNEGINVYILKSKKIKTMKKLLLVFTVAAFLTACGGNSSSTEATTTDSTTTTTVTAPSDSAVAPAAKDTSMAKMADSSANKMSADTTKK